MRPLVGRSGSIEAIGLQARFRFVDGVGSDLDETSVEMSRLTSTMLVAG
jgi:hypothetical protein